MIIYLDVLLFLQFTINVFVLIITGVMRQRKVKMCPILWTSLMFAALSVVIYILSIRLSYIVEILNLSMMLIIPRVAYPYEGINRWKKDCICFFTISIFLGGAMEAMFHILNNLRILNGSKFGLTYVYIGLAGIAISFLLLFSEIMQSKRDVSHFVEGMIIHKEKKVPVTVLFDSGNLLVSPYSQEHVVVISKELAQNLDFTDQNPLLIPFSTVGGSGLMEAYRVDFLQLPKGNRRYHFLAAVSKGNSRADIIINTE